MSNLDNKGKQISRRELLRMAAVGTAAVVASTQVGSVLAAAETAPVRAPMALDTVKLRLQENKDNYQKVVDRFIANNPNVQFEFLDITGADHAEIASKILSMLAAGQPIDIGYAATEAAELYAGNGLSVALDEYVKRDAKDMANFFSDCAPSLVEAMMYEGSLYELPRDFNAANMYYNTDLVKQAGLSAPPPDWDKDTFSKYAKAMTQKDSSGQTNVFGYGWTNRLWGSWMPWIFVNGSNLLTEERAPGGDWLWSGFYKDDPAAKGRGGGWRWPKPQANNPANVEALDFVMQMTKDGTAPAADLGGGQSLQGFFTSGKLGMTPAGGFWAGGLFNTGSPKGQFDVQLMPRWKSQRHQFGTGGHWMGKGSTAKDTVWAFLKDEVTLDSMNINGLFAPYILTTPTRRSMLTADRFEKTGPANWKIFYDTLDKYPDTAPIPAPAKSDAITNVFTKYTSSAMAFEMTAQQALDAMQKDLEAIYAQK